MQCHLNDVTKLRRWIPKKSALHKSTTIKGNIHSNFLLDVYVNSPVHRPWRGLVLTYLWMQQCRLGAGRHRRDAAEAAAIAAEAAEGDGVGLGTMTSWTIS